MKGYTLIELMVVISTITILSLIGIVGIRGAMEREELAAASRQLVGDFLSLQNKASAGMKSAGFSLERGENEDFYRIYKYLYTDFSPCGGEASGEWEYDCPGGEALCGYCKTEVNRIYFPSPQVYFESPASFAVYFFRPPNIGKARILREGVEGDRLEIVLKHEKLPFSKTVVIESERTVKIYEE